MQNKSCIKKKLTPWLVGLVALTLIIFGCLIFGAGRKDNKNMPKAFLDNANARVNTPTLTDSYHPIVDMIKPAVVGISLPGAQPFLQVWPSKENEGKTPLTGQQFQPQALTNKWHCPMCKVATSAQFTPGVCPKCPMCGMNMQSNSPAKGQAQALNNNLWQPSATQQNTTVKKEEYLQCQNCQVKLTPTVGIPWTGATCPNCKMGMAHIIRETVPQGGQAAGLFGPYGPVDKDNPFGVVQPQALNPTKPAPNLSQQTVGGIGAGIIVSSEGYVLTNYHLVKGQTNLTVTIFTPKGDRSYPGTVVATVPQSDLAIVQIQTKTATPIKFPVAPLGNSDTIGIGDTVLAIGNPFGLAQTVTSGIISAQRQNVTIEGHQLTNLIQTDAPINQGNSGGPLVNLQGEVIGINTAIYSPMQTHTGLGFAIPINQAKLLLAKFIENKSPQAAQAHLASMQWLKYPKGYPAAVKQNTNEELPAWIGVEFQMVNDIISEQLKLPFDRGILISQVYPNSPAAQAGLKKGDVIYRANGRRITDETLIRTFLADQKPGDTVNFVIFRNGEKISIDVTLAGGAWQQAAATVPPSPDGLLQGSEIEVGTADIVSLGLTLDKITPEVAFAFGIPKETPGVLISAVEGLSLVKGVREGDVIKQVNGRATPNLLSLFKELKKSNLGDGVTLGINRKGRPVDIFIQEKPSTASPGL